VTGFVGEVRMFASSFIPVGWVPCDGRELSIAQYGLAFSIVGRTYGGDGVSTFAVPDLRGRTPLGAGAGYRLTSRALGEKGGTESVTLTHAQMPTHAHGVLASGAQATEASPEGRTWAVAPDTAPYAPPRGSATLAPAALGTAGDGRPHANRSPVVGLLFGLCVEGSHPLDGWDDDTAVGEVRLWAGQDPPETWVACDGALLPIRQHDAMFTVVGTQFGGDGVTTFAVPDLRGRVPVHVGSTSFPGSVGGAEQVTLLPTQLPQHTHPAYGTPTAATTSSPAGATWAVAGRPQYAASAQVAAAHTGSAGDTQPHPNMPPYIALSFIIATQGVYPDRT